MIKCTGAEHKKAKWELAVEHGLGTRRRMAKIPIEVKHGNPIKLDNRHDGIQPLRRIRKRECSVGERLSGNGLPGIIGQSAALQRVLAMVRVVAPTGATLLINGATRPGKKLIAEAAYKGSDRSNGPFFKV